MSKPKSALIKITWHDDTVSQWHADSFREGEHSIEMNIGGCIFCIPGGYTKMAKLNIWMWSRK